MMRRRNSPGGQTLVETALALPLLLILLGGGYWFHRDLSLSSSAESAAHSQMLRAGRRQAGIEPRLSGTIHPGDNVARIEAHNDPLVGEVPLFRGLAGRTVASANVSLGKEPVARSSTRRPTLFAGWRKAPWIAGGGRPSPARRSGGRYGGSC